MKLIDLIEKMSSASEMTVTPATVMTDDAVDADIVTDVADVMVSDAQPAMRVPRAPGNKPMNDREVRAIRKWLQSEGENDFDSIQDVLDKCETDEAVRRSCLSHAERYLRADPDDDRRHCAQCQNRVENGPCLAAIRGDLKAGRNTTPVDDVPRRCLHYIPSPDDPDQRPGRVRWSHLEKKPL